MATPEQETCVFTGIALFRDNMSFRHATPVLFRSNLKDIKPEVFKIPHSELAMHTKAAGKEIVALFITPGMAFVGYSEPDGRCAFTYGTINEVISPELAEKVWPAYFPTEPEKKET